MEIGACTASSPQAYVELAQRLGTDREARDEITRAIGERASRLFERTDYARALSKILPDLVERSWSE
jgi:predicted O-linked N-acetylglucosamine transferase (SPINDLY family)